MFRQVLLTEFIKLRRSKITWITWLAITIMPIVSGLFMWIAQYPERAEQLGLLGQKAQFVGLTADWHAYFLLLLQIVGIGGMILVSVITAYVFGREFADGTVKNLLALPVSRHWFVMAKLIVVLIWFVALMMWLLIEGLIVGVLLKIPGLSTALAVGAVGDILLSALVAWLLISIVAWITVLGRGYLASLGFTIFMLVLGMVIGATGWGKWFPWSIVPLFAGVAGPRVETLAPGSLVVLVLTFLAGMGATIYHLRYADNTQ